LHTALRQRKGQGTEQRRLMARPQGCGETTANQRFSSPNIKTYIPLITVLITSVNTDTLLHNLFSGERVTP
ncbi:hypothetical protein QE248_07200, partial [Klebsiella pneumoniae]